MSFEDMKAGGKIKLPQGKWCDEQRAVYDQAGQYWLVRTK